MAKGRLLSRKIATDYNLNALSLEAEFLFLRAIPHLDRDGLITGDLVLLWAQVAPRRIELMDRTALLINEWLQQNLVTRYSSPQGPVLLFKAFRKHNLNINYPEEQASEFPPPLGWHRTQCGLIPSDPDLALALAQSLDSRSAYAQQVNRYATSQTKEPGASRGHPMSSQPYTTQQLATMWQLEQLTTEQMIGQLLTHINQLYVQLAELRTQKQAAQPPIQPNGHAPCAHANSLI